MSATLAFDKYQSAFLNWLEADTALAGDFPGVIVTNRIPDKKGDAPEYLLSARRVGGAVSQDNYPDHRPRLDVYGYSSSALKAAALVAGVIRRCAALPPARVGFRKDGVCCTDLAVVLGVVSTVDPRTEWYLAICSVRLTINPGVTA